MTPPDRQDQRNNRTQTTRNRDDRRRSDHLRDGAGRHVSGPLADDHPHVGDTEGLSPPLCGHPHHERGIGRHLVNTERGRGHEDHQ